METCYCRYLSIVDNDKTKLTRIMCIIMAVALICGWMFWFWWYCWTYMLKGCFKDVICQLVALAVALRRMITHVLEDRWNTVKAYNVKKHVMVICHIGVSSSIQHYICETLLPRSSHNTVLYWNHGLYCAYLNTFKIYTDMNTVYNSLHKLLFFRQAIHFLFIDMYVLLIFTVIYIYSRY